MSKTSKRRPRDPRYCSQEQFDENWQAALGRGRTQTIIVPPPQTPLADDEFLTTKPPYNNIRTEKKP